METKESRRQDASQKQAIKDPKLEKIQRIYVPVFALLIAILMTISIIVVMSTA